VPVPGGAQSHAALFRLFCEPEHSPLPVLVPPQLEEHLRILRRFRHFIRHSYAMHVDWERLRAGMELLANLHAAFAQRIRAALP
jgi:hypothetical protein